MNFAKSLKETLQASTGAPVVSKQLSSFEDEIDTYYHYGQKNGTSAFLDPLANTFRWRDGFLYAFSGYPGAGKSTFVNYLLLLRAKNEGKKIAIYSPESYPIADLIEELMRQYSGGSISKGFNDQIDEKTFKQAKEFINDHFYFLDFEEIPSLNDVFGEFSDLVNQENIGAVLIDPFNSIVEGADMSGSGNVSSFLKIALTQAKLFAVKHNVPVCLIEHPRSAGNDGAEHRPEPSPFMIYGGSMWWNKVDVFCTIDRDMFDSDNPSVVVKTWKIKKQRLMGKPGPVTLQFDYKTSRYS